MALQDIVAPATSPAIHTEGLTKHYGRVAALDGLSLSVNRAEAFGFLGPNGAGKTTAVKLLVGLTRPTSGTGRVLGAPMGDLRTRRRIGYLPELFRFQDWLSANEVLRLHCRLIGLERRQHGLEVERVLQTVGLGERADDRVATFSKGMQQRLGLAVALLGGPDLLLLDEPTSALDPVGRHDVREIIRELRDQGKTIFLNSHLLSEVEQVCDRVAIVDRGRVVESGTMTEILGLSHSVRLRVTGLNGQVNLNRFGRIDEADGWLRVGGIDEDMVPVLIEELVSAGVRIYAVEPSHRSLEDRFLQLITVSGEAKVSPSGRRDDVAR